MRGNCPCRGGPSAPLAEAPPGFRPVVRSSSPRPPLPPARLSLKISNREPLRLEIRVTLTKQTTGQHSNREKEAGFQAGSGLITQPGEMTTRPSASHRQNGLAEARKTATCKQKLTAHPSFLFRVEKTPAVYFLQLTNNSTYTHVSGRYVERRIKHEGGRPKTDGRIERPQVFRVVRERPELHPRRLKFTVDPLFLLRLKPIPAVCFLEFTSDFNLTM